MTEFRAWLPVELTDRVIDFLDLRMLPVAALVAKSWTPHATARMFARTVIWGAGKCQRARLPPASRAPMSFASFVQLYERNPQITKHVRELHLVCNDSRMELEGGWIGMFATLKQLCDGGRMHLVHLGLHAFDFCHYLDVRSEAFGLLLACAELRSVHLVNCRSLNLESLLVTLSGHPNLRTLAVLGGVTFDADSMTAVSAVPALSLPNSCRIYLQLEDFSKLLKIVLGIRPAQDQLNVIKLPVSSAVEHAMDPIIAAHGITLLQHAMSRLRSVEIDIIYGAPVDRLARMLDIFRQVPTLQLTFTCEGDVLKKLAKLFRRGDAGQTLVLAPLDAGNDTPAEPREWALVDAALARPHHAALASVVLFVDVDADPGKMELPRLTARGVLSVQRRDFGLNLWNVPLPWIAHRDRASECLS